MPYQLFSSLPSFLHLFFFARKLAMTARIPFSPYLRQRVIIVSSSFFLIRPPQRLPFWFACGLRLTYHLLPRFLCYTRHIPYKSSPFVLNQVCYTSFLPPFLVIRIIHNIIVIYPAPYQGYKNNTEYSNLDPHNDLLF